MVKKALLPHTAGGIFTEDSPILFLILFPLHQFEGYFLSQMELLVCTVHNFVLRKGNNWALNYLGTFLSRFAIWLKMTHELQAVNPRTSCAVEMATFVLSLLCTLSVLRIFVHFPVLSFIISKIQQWILDL